MRFTYSRWTGEVRTDDQLAEQIFDSVSDALLAGLSLESALATSVKIADELRGEALAPDFMPLDFSAFGLDAGWTDSDRLRAVLQMVEARLDEVIEAELHEVAARDHNSVNETDSEWDASSRGNREDSDGTLENLPDDPGMRIAALSEYSFASERAHTRLHSLVAALHDHLSKPQETTAQDSPGATSVNDVASYLSMLHSERARNAPSRKNDGEWPDGSIEPLSSGGHLDGTLPSGKTETSVQCLSPFTLQHSVSNDSLSIGPESSLRGTSFGRRNGTLLSRAHSPTEPIQEMTHILQTAGLIEASGNSFAPSSNGLRRMGRRALMDIFRHLHTGRHGEHTLGVVGPGVDRSHDSKPYEYGEASLLNVTATLFNALKRGGTDGTIRLAESDFEVFRTGSQSSTATVLMLDMSRSMLARNCFLAAKKVVLALHMLIAHEFPRDSLYVVVFSEYAHQIPPEAIYRAQVGEDAYGTNMQHGLMVARKLLARHAQGSRQIVLITDGEPTAHCTGDGVAFSYPPSSQTLAETLREAKRCARNNIVINTFMLGRSPAFIEFVDRMARVNGGRALFTTPEHLGEYVIFDYLSKRGRIRGV